MKFGRMKKKYPRRPNKISVGSLQIVVGALERVMPSVD